jgi:hypothetical protein
MKKPTLALLAVALFLPCSSLAQHSSKAAESTPSAQTASKDSHKALTLTGQASADGKTLVADNDDIWTVTNPSVLAGHEGQYVSVRCQANPDKKEIHLFTVKAALRDAKYVAKSSDAAFRR